MVYYFTWNLNLNACFLLAVPSSGYVQQHPLLKKSGSQPTQDISNLSDDEPLYDAVASDDDYAQLTPLPKPQPVGHGALFSILYF